MAEVTPPAAPGTSVGNADEQNQVTAEDVQTAQERVADLRQQIQEANDERLRVAASRENEVTLARLAAEEAQLLLELQRAKAGVEQVQSADQVAGPVVSAHEAMEAAVRAAKADQELADADAKVQEQERERLEAERQAEQDRLDEAARQNAEAAAAANNQTEGQ